MRHEIYTHQDVEWGKAGEARGHISGGIAKETLCNSSKKNY
jgi:hypothetical protein